MSGNTQSEALQNVSKFHSSLKSLYEFDRIEVFGVITTLLAKTDEDNCFIGTYLRTRGNIETLLEITNAKHFQAVAMVSRALFELAVDVRLMDQIPNGIEKMLAAVEVEKLRCARKAVAFKTANPTADIDPIFQSFAQLQGPRIDTKHRTLWPSKKDPSKLSIVKHWTGLDLSARIKLLKAPFEQIYELNYPRLSWYVHPGLTGVVNVSSETFTLVCSLAFKLAADAYWEVLKAVIQRFKIEKANKKIHQQMKVAQLLPFSEDSEQEQALLRTIQ
jgi:hypothetical protein